MYLKKFKHIKKFYVNLNQDVFRLHDTASGIVAVLSSKPCAILKQNQEIHDLTRHAQVSFNEFLS